MQITMKIGLEKLVAIILSISMVLVIAMQMREHSIAVHAVSENEVVSWMDSKNGSTINDGGTQCVAAFNSYLRLFGISNPIGQYPVSGARQIFDYNAPSGWQKISGSGNYHVGDVVIWNGNVGGGWGHVGIVYSTSGTVRIFDQNWVSKNTCGIHNISNEGSIRGVFRPFNANKINTPVDTRYNTNVSCTAPSKIYTYDEYGNHEGNRYVDPGDSCTAIEAYTTGFWKIDYPSGSTRRQAYMKLSEWNPFSFINVNKINTPVDTRYNTNVSCTAPSKIYTYDEYGNHEGDRYVDPGDSCTAIEAYTTGFWKIDYPSGSTRRQAYMKLSEWNPFSQHTHNYTSKVTKEATCKEEGIRTYTCSGCNNSYTEKIAKTDNHKYTSKVTKEANCKEEGIRTYTCSVCQKNYTETIAKTDNHKYTSKVTKEATCKDEGVRTYTCSVCQKSYTEKIAKTNDHKYTSKVTKEATCEEEGVRTYTCSVCEHSYTEQLPKLDCKLTIHYNVNGGIIADDSDFYVEDSYVYTVKDQKILNLVWEYNHKYKGGLHNASTFKLSRPGYAFTGWSLEKNGTRIFDQDDESLTANDIYPDIVTKSGTVTLYAQWYSKSGIFQGSGTAEDPYQISSKADLEKMRDLVNDATANKVYGYANYIQTADIDLENVSWVPIGKGVDANGTYDAHKTSFNGNYNGNHHEIINMNVDGNANIRYNCAGLFSYIFNGSVSNLIVKGTINVEKVQSLGGIVGELQRDSIITNCAFIGDVIGGKVSNGERWYGAGGIVGYANNGVSISDCYHTGTVKTASFGGGIVGRIHLDKSTNENAGEMIIRNCYHANGTIIGDEASGAIAGICVIENDVSNSITINNCYAPSDCNAQVGKAGVNVDTSLLLRSSEIKKCADDLGKPFTEDLAKINNGYPIFEWQTNVIPETTEATEETTESTSASEDSDIIDRLPGDVNNDGQVNLKDVVLLSRFIAGGMGVTINESAADVNADGMINLKDVVLIRRYIVGGWNVTLK